MNHEIRCYGQVSGPGWTQETYESASRDAGRRVRQLRAAGFHAASGSMGKQVTNVGTVAMTMVHVNADACDLPQVRIERI